MPRGSCLSSQWQNAIHSLDPVRPAQEHAPNDAPNNTIQLINNNAKANNNRARSTTVFWLFVVPIIIDAWAWFFFM
jgi:hypothetical protein